MSYDSTGYAKRTEDLQREIDDAIVEGWRIESETPERVVLVKRNYGDLGIHVLLAVLTAWWSFGLINIAYGAFKYVNDSQRRVLRDSRSCPECGMSVAADAEYCQHCGAEMPATAPITATTDSCPECGSGVAPGAQYCENCGAELAESATGETPEASETTEA
ncbi:zinc ribbon domain-containing protein [Halorussus halophilus]|uniref:zinc ribbon domain-containing protein n=1 Tax=Halorussus halophilus TaxID=2650975 RepID=UPI0013010E19|nr:zinc ribbon domain-containing protein [Halorussus halophilus]